MLKTLICFTGLLLTCFCGAYGQQKPADIKQAIDSIKPSEVAKKYLNNKVKQAGLPLNKLDSLGKPGSFKLSDLSIENNAYYLKDVPARNEALFQNNTSLFGKLTIAKLPINLDLSATYNSMSGFEPLESSLFKFRFDRDRMRRAFMSDIERYSNVKKMAFGGLDVQQYLTRALIAKLRNSSLNYLSTNPVVLKLLNNPHELSALLKMDEDDIRQRVKTILQSQKQAIVQKIQNGSKQAEQIAQKQINEGTELLSEMLISVKKTLSENGLDERKIELIQKFLAGNASPAELTSELLKELQYQPQFGAAKKVYALIKDFKAGDFADKIPGNFNRSETFVKGVSTTFNTNLGPIEAGIGLNRDIGYPKDAQFTNTVYSPPTFLAYLSLPTNRFAGNGKISWVNQRDQQFTSFGYNVNTLPKNTMSFTVSQNLKSNTIGKLSVDISKSASQYMNSAIPGSNYLMLQSNNALSNYFKDNFFETLSVGINHELNIKEAGFSDKLYFSYSGLGYQAPGQGSIGSMNMRVGGNIKKTFFKQKLSLAVRSDIKNTPISFTENQHWQNYQFQFDGRLRMGKSSAISLKYMQDGVSKMADVTTRMYSSGKLQADINASYQLGGLYAFSYVNLGRQRMTNPISIQSSEFMTLNMMHSVVIGEFSISGTLFYNKELKQSTILGDMLNADLGCQYVLFKTLSMSSSMTYLDNLNVAQQIGLRQNVQLVTQKKFDVSAYLDLRKNIIEPRFPDLYSAARGEIAVKYYIGK